VNTQVRDEIPYNHLNNQLDESYVDFMKWRKGKPVSTFSKTKRFSEKLPDYSKESANFSLIDVHEKLYKRYNCAPELAKFS